MRFSYSTLREIAQGMNRRWDLQKGGTLFSARIIEDVDRALEVLLIFSRVNGAAVEGLMDINGHRIKKSDEGDSISWGVARTKGESHKCKLANNMFFHSDFFQLFLNKKQNITKLLPETTVFIN